MPAQTQEERKADTRARLIAAAADLFARKGFHAVSAEALADAADRTTGALYSHFGSKDGLLLALVEQWLDESAARISADVEGRRIDDGCGRCGPTP
jgi:AcrR family transcriptional regulator